MKMDFSKCHLWQRNILKMVLEQWLMRVFSIGAWFVFAMPFLGQEMVTAKISNGKYQMKLVEELRFGAVEEDDYYIWSSIQTQILPGSNGQIFIVDHTESRILLFDDTGRFVKVAARKGEGPGELQYINAVSRSASGIFYVMDTPSPGNEVRIKRFNPDFTFRDEISTVGLELRADALYITPDEKHMAGLFVTFDAKTKGLSVINGVLNLDNRSVVNKFNEDVSPLGDSRIRNQNQWIEIISEGLRQKQRGGLVAVGDDGVIYSGSMDQYEISMWKPGSKTPFRVVKGDYRPKPYTKGEIDNLIEHQYLNMNAETQKAIARATLRKGYERANLPFHPPILGIIPMEDKGFLAIRSSDIESGRNVADIFSSNGEFLGKLEMGGFAMCIEAPGHWTPCIRMTFQENKAYALFTNQDGETHAVRYGYSLEKL